MGLQSTDAALTAFQVAIRPGTNIGAPHPPFIAALAQQFDHALRLAEGRLCVSVANTAPGDPVPAAIADVLQEAATLHTDATTLAPVQVRIESAWYTEDGYYYTLAQILASTGIVRQGEGAIQ